MTGEYRVKLEAFEGPLDLLLHLVREAEVEIEEIPIASVTEQYLGYLQQIERVDVEVAGEFLVMAATLMEIKSRMIAASQEGVEGGSGEGGSGEKGPRRLSREDEAGDPRVDLVRQLLAYKAHRDAADRLEELWALRERRVESRPIGVSREELAEAFESVEGVELDELSLVDLAEAFGRIAASVDFAKVGEHEVVSDETPIELHAEDLLDRLRREREAGGQLTLWGAFRGRTRSEMVGLLLAMLDLVRQRRLSFRQGQDAGGARGEIVLEAVAGDEAGEGGHGEGALENGREETGGGGGR